MRKSNLGKSRSKRVAERAARSQRGGIDAPKKTGNSSFSATAQKVHPANKASQLTMRGGIRF